MKTYDAKIIWISADEGGRKVIPTSDNIYCPFIVVGNQPFDPQKDLWSVQVVNNEQLGHLETSATLHFLSEKAPFDLKSGDHLKLYEGNKLVANGIIL